MRGVVSIAAAALLVHGACALDPAGTEQTGAGGGGTGASSSSTTGAASSGQGSSASGGDGGSGGSVSGPGSSSSSGEGGEPSSGGAGPGGDGGSGGQGGAGGLGGDGGAGGRGGSGGRGGVGGAGGQGGVGGNGGGGGQGGGGVIDVPYEWLARIHGGGNQGVLDVAYDPLGLDVYAVGFVAGDDVRLDGVVQFDAEGVDAFVARFDAVTGALAWFRGFGGASNDQARSIEVTDDGRVFISGVAEGVNQDNGDLFAQFGTNPTESPFGWLVEVDPASGDLSTGVTWQQAAFDEVTDVAVTSSRAVAIGTCTSCGRGRDLTAATIDRGTDALFSDSVSESGDQLGRAAAGDPIVDGFAVAGHFSGTYDAGFGSESCVVVGVGNTDVFVARYELMGGQIECKWAVALGSAGDDVAEGIVLDEVGDVYVAAYFADDFGSPLVPGPKVVKLSNALAGQGLWWTVMGSVSSDVYGLSRHGGLLVASGRADDGYAVDLDPVTGLTGAFRYFVGPADALAIDAFASARAVGGSWSGTVDFGPSLGTFTSNGVDGFVVGYRP